MIAQQRKKKGIAIDWLYSDTYGIIAKVRTVHNHTVFLSRPYKILLWEVQ